MFFGPGLYLAAGDLAYVFKDASAHFINRLDAVDDATCREIQMRDICSNRGVFDASFTTGAIALPIVVPRPVVKTTNVATGAIQTGSGFLIVSGPLHQIQPPRLRSFGVFNHAFDASRSGLGNCSPVI
jgi:hypothetical protein